MTTPKFSKLLQLVGTQNNARSDLKESAKKQRAPSASRLAVLLTLLMLASAIFSAVSHSSSSFSFGPTQGRATLSNPKTQTATQRAASRRKQSPVSDNFLLRGLARPRAALSAPLPILESIATYAADCTTPQNDFNFGETICAVVSNANVGGRLVWGHTNGRLARDTMVNTNPKSDSFSITPTSVLASEVVDNKGTWKIETIDSDGAPFAVAYFTVHDPATPTADLNVFKAPKGGYLVNEDTDVSFSITVANQGPDAATAVKLADVTPAVTTFVSLTQDAGGPTFTCAGSDCTISSLAKGAQATFTAVYHTNGVTTATVTPFEASVSSAPGTGTPTAELRPADNTASGEITINVNGATTACTLVCPQNINANANTSEGSPTPVRGAHVTFASAEPDGDCGAVTATPASGSFFPVGTTTVNVSSATGGGSCSFTVTVTDTGVEPPTISCPAGIEVTADSNCERTVTLGTPSTTGSNLTVSVMRSDGKAMYNCDSNGENCVRKSVDLPFPAGVTTVTWTATAHDGDGLETGNASCTQTIIVDDVVAPTISASPQVASADATCQAAIPDFTLTATVADNCACASSDTSESCQEREPITVIQSPAPGTLVGLGPHTITLTANDGSSNNGGAGNTATTTTTFTVNDTTAPTVTAPADSSASANASCLAPVPDYTAGSTVADNCSSTPTVTQSPAAGTLVGFGPHTVTVTATDAANNSGSDTVVFTVNDTTAPVINLTGASTITVECHTSFTDPGATASDNCDSSVPVSVAGSVNVNTVGTYTLTYTGSDDSGNPATPVVRTVNVVDTTAPAITCPSNVVVNLPLNSTATSMVVTYSPVTATESCSTATVNSSPASGSVFPVGTTTVNATATDAANNSSSCSFTVTVLYNFTGFFSPVANAPTLNIVNAGKAVPVKFSLSGNKGLNIFAANNPYSISLNCSTSDPGVDVTETLNAGGSSLSYTTDQYNYVWKTESSWAGTCRQLVLTLNDGSVHTANFKFK